MTKRLISMVLAAAMMVSVMAGCTGTAPSSTPPAVTPSDSSSTAAPSSATGEALSGTIKFWTHQNPAWDTSYKKQIDKFTALNPGVKFETESFPYPDLQSKLQTSLVSGKGADIYVIFGSWAADYMPTGALSKVPESMSKTMDADYYASAVGGFKYENAYYGVPLEFNIEYGGMLVNKKIFDQKKLAYPTTWAELEKISDENSVRNGEIMEMRGFDFVTYDGLTYQFLGMILSKGGQYLSADSKSVNFDTPEALDAMTKMVDYVKNRNWSNLEGFGQGVGGFYSVFKDEGMMSVVGPWAVAQGTESYALTYGTDYEYVPVPQYGDKNAFAAETGWGLVVPEKSPVKDLAWKFVEWFSQPENLLEHNLACTQIPPSKSVAADPKFLEALPYTKPIIDILEGGQYIGDINTDLFKMAVMNTFIEMVTTDKHATIADGLKAMQDAVNAINTKK